MPKTFPCFPLLLWALTFFIGCNPAPEPSPTELDLARADEVSNVPIRVWFVSQVSDPEIIRRQWRSDSEQPLDIQAFNPGELFAMDSLDCDVLVYPARLMGELLHLGWIVPLPSTLQSPGENSGENQLSLPQHWLGQGGYGGQRIAVPLAAGVPVFLASEPLMQRLDDSAEGATWKQVLAALPVETAEEREAPSTKPDPEALVDRFLAIAATVSQRDPSYGLLFDMQSMRSRLLEPEFQRAAELLQRLARQPGGRQAIMGSHSEAWKWLSSSSEPAVAVAVASLVDAQIAEAEGGQVIDIQELAEAPEPERDRPAVAAWDGGGALVASLAARCRQSGPSIAFLRWLQQGASRDVLSKVVQGVASETPPGGVESLAWRARGRVAELSSTRNVSLEPRLPSARAYRAALAESLLALLSGEMTVPQAMQAADRRWNEISRAAGGLHRSDYEQSLDLAR